MFLGPTTFVKLGSYPPRPSVTTLVQDENWVSPGISKVDHEAWLIVRGSISTDVGRKL